MREIDELFTIISLNEKTKCQCTHYSNWKLSISQQVEHTLEPGLEYLSICVIDVPVLREGVTCLVCEEGQIKTQLLPAENHVGSLVLE